MFKTSICPSVTGVMVRVSSEEKIMNALFGIANLAYNNPAASKQERELADSIMRETFDQLN